MVLFDYDLRNGATDPTDMASFKCALQFRHPDLVYHKGKDGEVHILKERFSGMYNEFLAETLCQRI